MKIALFRRVRRIGKEMRGDQISSDGIPKRKRKGGEVQSGECMRLDHGRYTGLVGRGKHPLVPEKEWGMAQASRELAPNCPVRGGWALVINGIGGLIWIFEGGIGKWAGNARMARMGSRIIWTRRDASCNSRERRANYRDAAGR